MHLWKASSRRRIVVGVRPSEGLVFGANWRNPVTSRGVTHSALPPPPQVLGNENRTGLSENMSDPVGMMNLIPT